MSDSRGKVPITLVRETTDSTVAALFERLSKGSVGLVNIHRTLANSPAVFEAFIGLAHALRFETELEPADRELAILRVLTIHHGHYEGRHHRRLGAAAGLDEAQLDVAENKLECTDFTPRQKAILHFADAFAANQGVDAETSNALREHYGDRQVVELTLTLSLYLGLAHLTNALDVPTD